MADGSFEVAPALSLKPREMTGKKKTHPQPHREPGERSVSRQTVTVKHLGMLKSL